MIQRSTERTTFYLSLVACALLWIVPFIQPFHTSPIPSFYSEWLAILIGLVSFSGLLYISGSINLLIPRVSLYIGMLVFFIAAQSLLILHPYSSQTITWLFYLSWAILLALVGASLKSLVGQEKLVNIIAWSALLGGILSSLISHVLLILNAADTQEYSQGILGQRNHLATYFTLALCGLLYLQATKKISIALSVPSAILLISGLYITSSRSPILYLGGLILLSFYYYYRTDTKSPLYAHLIKNSILVFIGFVAIQYFQTEINVLISHDIKPALNRIFTADYSQEIRLSEWRKAWEIFISSPVLGVGVDQYAWHSYLNSHEKLQATIFTHSHNIFLQFLAETGIIGTILLLLVLCTWLYQFLRTEPSIEAWFIGGALLVLFIHSNLEHPLWSAYFLGISAILLGIADQRIIRLNKLSRDFSKLAGLLMLIGALIFSASVFTAYRSMETLAYKNNYKNNVEFYPIYRMLLQQIGKNPLLTPNAEYMLGGMTSLDANNIQAKLALNQRIARWRPEAQNVYRYSILLALKGNKNESIKQLHMAATGFPNGLDEVIDIIKKLDKPELSFFLSEAEKIKKI